MSDSLPMTVTALSEAQRIAILNIVRRAARAEILPRFRNLRASDISQKTGPEDLVTEADTGAEAMIARGLSRMFPGALIVGEEAVSKDPKIAEKIAEAETAFTIDPVDGTWNFARGLTTFGTMLAMTRFGKPVWGLLYDPVMDDAISAAIDGPALLRRPRKPSLDVKVSGGGTLGEINGYVPLYMIPEDKRGAIAATLPLFGRSGSLRCSCHEYRTLAQGGVDFVLSAGLTPWDHAPGALIAERAGGHIAMLDGSAYNAATREGFLLAAANKDTWDRVRDAFAVLTEDA